MVASPQATGPIRVGETLPDFSLKLSTTDGVRDFHLKEELGSGPIVLSFFPMAFTSTCTKQMCETRDRAGDLASLGAKVFGVSVDTPRVNLEFVRMHAMGHGILSDPNYEVVPRIWALATVGGVHHRAKRGVVVADSAGVVRWVWIAENPGEWIGVPEIEKHLG